MSTTDTNHGPTPGSTEAACPPRLAQPLREAQAHCESTGRRQAMYRVPIECAVPLLRRLIEQEAGRLATVTGIDVRDGTELIYHVCFDADHFTANLKVLVPRTTDTMESITPWLPGAEFIEREIHDLLGVKFPNHPRMERLILSDDWPEGVYPLRRGFKKEDGRPQTRNPGS